VKANSALVQVFERAGFILVRTANHYIWRCPCGHTQLTCAASPGKGRAVENTQAQIRRALRACTPMEKTA
jgi:hypothetical protein